MNFEGLPNMINDVFVAMQYHFVYGAFFLKPYALALMATLATIDMAVKHLFKLDQDHFQVLIKNIFKYGFFLWLILIYPELMSMILDSFVQIGLIAGAGNMAPSELVNPASIMEKGYTVMNNIYHVIDMSNVSPDSSGNVDPSDVTGNTLKMFFGSNSSTNMLTMSFFQNLGMLTYLAFMIMGAQIFLTYLEFNIVGALGIILLPFNVLKSTEHIGRKAIDAIVNTGIKIMVLTFILCIAEPIIQDIINWLASLRESNPDYVLSNLDCLRLLSTVAAVTLLCWRGPNMVANLLAGSSISSADSLVNRMQGGGGGARTNSAANGKATAASMQNMQRAAAVPQTSSDYGGVMSAAAFAPVADFLGNTAGGQAMNAIAAAKEEKNNGSRGGSLTAPPNKTSDTQSISGTNGMENPFKKGTENAMDSEASEQNADTSQHDGGETSTGQASNSLNANNMQDRLVPASIGGGAQSAAGNSSGQSIAQSTESTTALEAGGQNVNTSLQEGGGSSSGQTASSLNANNMSGRLASSDTNSGGGIHSAAGNSIGQSTAKSAESLAVSGVGGQNGNTSLQNGGGTQNAVGNNIGQNKANTPNSDA
jgi:type IV secretion system protein TrbL